MPELRPGLLWLSAVALALITPLRAEVGQVQRFGFLVGEYGAGEPQMSNSDTETGSETSTTRKVKPAARASALKRSSESGRHVGHPGTKARFMGMMPWELCCWGEEGRNQKRRWLDISGRGDSEGCQSSQPR